MMHSSNQLYRTAPETMHGSMHSGHWVNTLLFAVLIIIIGIFVYLFYRYTSTNTIKNKISEDPKNLIKLRLAKGEIDQSEYDALLKKIS